MMRGQKPPPKSFIQERPDGVFVANYPEVDLYEEVNDCSTPYTPQPPSRDRPEKRAISSRSSDSSPASGSLSDELHLQKSNLEETERTVDDDADKHKQEDLSSSSSQSNNSTLKITVSPPPPSLLETAPHCDTTMVTQSSSDDCYSEPNHNTCKVFVAKNSSAAPPPVPLDDETERHANNNNNHKKSREAVSCTKQQEYVHRQMSFLSWSSKASRNMATYAGRWLVISLAITLAISAIGFVLGEFTIDSDNKGWQSRGTLIADRQAQVWTITQNQWRLAAENNDAVWEDLIQNVQPGWETNGDNDRRRNLESAENTLHGHRQRTLTTTAPTWERSLQLDDLPLDLPDCTLRWYGEVAGASGNSYLWPVWEIKKGHSALDPEAIRAICKAEENTVRYLEENGLCGNQCGDDKCQPPFSIVLMARIWTFDFKFTRTCDDLADTFATVKDSVESQLIECVETIRANYTIGEEFPENCPAGFHPYFIDDLFPDGKSNDVRYSSSAFSTTRDIGRLYDHVDGFDRSSSSIVDGAYDTQWEDFNEWLVDESLTGDMTLAIGSAVVTGFAILLHTRSMFVTILGLCQITLAFPVAFFFYRLVIGLEFFPFLNFIGIFVVFAIGADDIFVAVDKWKNARIEHPNGTTQQVAAVALPDAAQSMFLTTITTAIAFFGTAICKVAPLRMFAVFSGLLIVFDYILCLLLVCPALCLYDRWLQKGNNCFLSCHCLQQSRAPDGHQRTEAEFRSEEEAHPSLIRRILAGYYNLLHKGRFPLLLVIIGAVAACSYFTAQLELSASSDVRLLEKDHEFEQNYLWRRKLLGYNMLQDTISRGYVIWGVTPADTGDHNNPEEFTQLVLDDSFDPSSEESQVFLKRFCKEIFEQDLENRFASPITEGFECPMDKFEAWMQSENQFFLDANENRKPSDAYMNNCGGFTSLPIAQYLFHRCATAYAREVSSRDFLQRNGEIEIIWFAFQSRISFDFSYSALDDEWNLIEDWVQEQSRAAPPGVKNMYASSADFWWYDTNSAMLQAAIGAAGIALGAAAIVMLFSSRSIEITLIALATIGFILVSVMSLLVASDWTLGFLESICIAILIGISCDFVLHFGHSYSTIPGNRNRHERTKTALILMGPSILAAAFTTICAAIVMLFTVITFFTKFAQILFYTILMATAGSFIVFLTLTDIFGPSNPTALVDKSIMKLRNLTTEEAPTPAASEEPEQSWEEFMVKSQYSWDSETSC